MIATVTRLGPSCLSEEQRARTISTQVILSVYVVSQNLLIQEQNYLKTCVRTFLTRYRIPPLAPWRSPGLLRNLYSTRKN